MTLQIMHRVHKGRKPTVMMYFVHRVPVYPYRTLLSKVGCSLDLKTSSSPLR